MCPGHVPRGEILERTGTWEPHVRQDLTPGQKRSRHSSIEGLNNVSPVWTLVSCSFPDLQPVDFRCQVDRLMLAGLLQQRLLIMGGNGVFQCLEAVGVA